MPERAQVTSLEAIESFRAKLIVYREKAGRVLDEVGDDVTRTRLWLQGDQQVHWEKQIRRRDQDLKQAQQELFSAQMSGMRDASFVQQSAVVKCKRAVREAEERLKVVKQWGRQYDQLVEPIGRQVEKFRHTLRHDLGEAVAYLANAVKTLADYAELSPASPQAKVETAAAAKTSAGETPK